MSKDWSDRFGCFWFSAWLISTIAWRVSEGSKYESLFEFISFTVLALAVPFGVIIGLVVGGGSLLGELDQVIRDSTGLPVSIADDPLSCVVQGTGKCAENLKDLRSVLSSSY